jgi:uncharacterized membrane protein YfcA
MEIATALLWLLFSVGVGAYGTLVGAGGGFIIVPVLLLLAGASPQQAAGTSLVVVALNALSGTFSYARMGRVDWQTGGRFALAAVPGAVVGAYLSTAFSGRVFAVVVGVVLIAIALLLALRPMAAGKSAPPTGPRRRWQAERTLVDADGEVFAYRYTGPGGLALSVGVGFLSSVLGIGGGIIHVPAMVRLFGFPAHVATATSQFILAITAVIGAATHLALGHVLPVPALAMGIGAIVGAQVGARLSRRLRGARIVQLLALALAVVGVRLLVGGL